MHRFLIFLRSKAHLILFIIIEVLAFRLMFRSSDYHRAFLWYASNDISGAVSEVSHQLDRYRGLYNKNLELMRENALLDKEVLRLRAVIERYNVDSLRTDKFYKPSEAETTFPYQYTVAEVVSRTNLSHSHFITINKGSRDGVQPDMGVLSSNGVVGMVVSVGHKYSKVLPLINNRIILSCKLNGRAYSGSLQWDGVDVQHTLLKNLPKHTHYEIGDSICTSGYSTVFPEGVSIGRVAGVAKSEDDSFLALRVKLSTDFSSLKYVYLIEHTDKAAIDSIEQVRIH